MRAGIRPFIVHSSTPITLVRTILSVTPNYPRHWSEEFIELISKVNFFYGFMSMLVLYSRFQSRLENQQFQFFVMNVKFKKSEKSSHSQVKPVPSVEPLSVHKV